MDEQFGSAYAHSLARDYVLAELGGRTVEQALANGADAKAVWRAVCAAFNVPARLRLTRRRPVLSWGREAGFQLRHQIVKEGGDVGVRVVRPGEQCG